MHFPGLSLGKNQALGMWSGRVEANMEHRSGVWIEPWIASQLLVVVQVHPYALTIRNLVRI